MYKLFIVKYARFTRSRSNVTSHRISSVIVKNDNTVYLKYFKYYVNRESSCMNISCARHLMGIERNTITFDLEYVVLAVTLVIGHAIV